MSKPKEILMLEKELGVEFVEVKDTTVKPFEDSIATEYSVNTENQVTNLRIKGLFLKSIPNGLFECKHLKYLTFTKSAVSDFSKLVVLKELENLALWENQIKDISWIQELINLKEIYLHSNFISDINIIEKLPNIEKLSLGDNSISDISALSKLTNLKTLALWKNKITDISPLKNLNKLENLTLHFNHISDISPLSELKKIFFLRLHENKIFDISPLKELKELAYLDLKNNQIKDISPLKELNNLETLNLNDNKIEVIPAEIIKLSNLKDFSIHGNFTILRFIYSFLYPKAYDTTEKIIEERIIIALSGKLPFLLDLKKIGTVSHGERFTFLKTEQNEVLIDVFKDKQKITGINIYVLGNQQTQKEVLYKIRSHFDNELSDLESKVKDYSEKSFRIGRTFFYPYKGKDILIHYDRLMNYKLAEKNTYFNDEHGREIDVDDLLKYIGAENEKIKTEWKGSQYITKIEIENFKIFSKIETELSKNINVLIGKNGLGKTSFLQALTLGLLPLSNVDKSNELEKYISFNSNKSDITLWWGEEYRKVFVFKNELKHENYLDFPQKLILAYGVNLNTAEKFELNIIDQLIYGNAIPYSTKSIFKDYSTDFYDPLILLERLFIEKKGKENKLIDNIINLIKTSLNDFLSLFSEPEKILLEGEYADYYFIDLNNNKLKTGNLSEGYKDFILQVTDIIVRIIASRNSVFENKKQDITINLLKNVKGVVIIDEFDRHLHPVLQRKFLEKLSEYFQNIQFILSTHNIFSFQSAEGFTALIINTTDNKLNIIKKEISKGLSLESIYNQYFDGNYEIFGNSTEKLLTIFKELIDKQANQDLTNKEKKEFKKVTKELLIHYGERVKGIVNREIRQFERLTDKTIEL